MGRMSELHLGAVGVGAMIFNFVYWNFGFLRMGTTGITAQAFGKKDNSEIIQTLGRALLLVIILALLIILLQRPFGNLSFYLMNVSESQIGLVKEYFFIRIWAAPATLGLYAMMGWFFGMQNAVYPLILTIIINIVNIGLSFLFILHYGMEVDGVAWGTVIAQYVGFIVALGLFAYKYGYLLKSFKRKAVTEWVALKNFIDINQDIFIRTFCLTFAFGFFYSQSSAQGETILAINVILLQFLNWMSYGVDGFAFASESLVGKYAGAKDREKLRKAVLFSFYWGFALALIYSITYGFAGIPLLHIFTDQTSIIDASVPFLFWMVLLPVIGTPCYIWDGVYIGLTASKAMRNSMFISLAIFFLAFYITVKAIPLGNHGLWLTLLIFLGARGIIQTLWYNNGIVLKETNHL